MSEPEPGTSQEHIVREIKRLGSQLVGCDFCDFVFPRVDSVSQSPPKRGREVFDSSRLLHEELRDVIAHVFNSQTPFVASLARETVELCEGLGEDDGFDEISVAESLDGMGGHGDLWVSEMGHSRRGKRVSRGDRFERLTYLKKLAQRVESADFTDTVVLPVIHRDGDDVRMFGVFYAIRSRRNAATEGGETHGVFGQREVRAASLLAKFVGVYLSTHNLTQSMHSQLLHHQTTLSETESKLQNTMDDHGKHKEELQFRRHSASCLEQVKRTD